MQKHWGSWSFKPETLVLACEAAEAKGYEVDLERCTTSAEMLDWLCQVAEKDWATPDTVGNLVLAFNDLLRPNATVCSMGVEGEPIEDVRKAIKAASRGDS
ncbi:MAG TPA: hypothetical protein VGK67_36460 [Myxococcales bacterium]